MLKFGDSKPTHLTFKVQTAKVSDSDDSQEKKNEMTLGLESCDLRLTSVKNDEVVPNSDIVFFRMGFYNYHKLNMHD